MKLWNMEYIKQDFLFENLEDLNEILLYLLAISWLTTVFTLMDFILGIVFERISGLANYTL